MLALPVEKSREQRQQRLQARFRDRGGIFVPSEKNALIDILLARSVTGESPSKLARSRKKQGSSPVRENGKVKASDAKHGQGPAIDVAPLTDGKLKGQANKSRKSSKEPRGKATREDHGDASDNGLPVTGPDDKAEVAAKGARLAKGKARAKVTVVPDKSRVAPKRTGRPPKATGQPREIPADDDDDDRKDQPLRPAPKPRGRPPKTKPQSQPSNPDAPEEAPEKPKKVAKRRQRAADSDREDDDASLDYMHTSRKRPKAGPAKSAATTVRRKKPVQVTQPGDSDDSSAIIIVIKKKAAKAQSLVDPKKPVSEASAMINDDEDDSSPRPIPKSRQKAKPQTPKKSLYLDDEEQDSEATQVNPADIDHDVKTKSARAPAAGKAGHDAAIKSKHRVKSTRSSKAVEIPDTDGEECEPPPNHATKVKTKSSANQKKAKHKTNAENSIKRSRDIADTDGHNSDSEGSVAPTRKRAKIVAAPVSDDETLVEPAQSKAPAISPPAVAKGQSQKTTLKENAVARKGKFTSEKRKQVQPKPSQAKARKGPPQEVLNRMKARPPGSPQADSDRDPIDFLS